MNDSDRHDALPPLPTEMVLASAGSGKTYRLSSRLIGLLARGAKPEAILASTFTRKAAAEILERVLLRLARAALDPNEAKELAGAAWFARDGEPGPPPGFLTQEECCALLGGLLRSLHRANIGTLDGFFAQIAKTFAEELGLPPGWRMVEGPEEDRMRSEAIEAVLTTEDVSVMAELVRILGKGDGARGVHSILSRQVDALLELKRTVDPTAENPWRPDFAGVEPGARLSDAVVQSQCTTLADEFAACDVPLTKAGTPNKAWAKTLASAAADVEARDWDAFFDGGLGGAIVKDGVLVPGGEVTFAKGVATAEVGALLDTAVGLARAQIGQKLVSQVGALERLAERYERAFTELQTRSGAYRFSDITHRLAESALMGGAEELYFRLDARLRHLLLDEFQDTSLPQWHVLKPLMDELTAGSEGDRAAVVVADPKQSIYGWRGARPELAEDVQVGYRLRAERLPNSYRSGPVILEAVAQVFEHIAENDIVRQLDDTGSVAARWATDFLPQAAANPDQPGYVSMIAGPHEEGQKSVKPKLLDFAAERIASLHSEAPGQSIGVLVRTNKAVGYLIAALRQRDVSASGEGGTPLTDTRPVNALLALLRLADHPGNTLARYHVAKTPVGELDGVGYTDFRDSFGAAGVAQRVRERLVREGYGPTLDTWVRELEPVCDPLEIARLGQLVELGFRWDARPSLRPDDFVRLVEKQGMEAPTGASVRVMTVHQSKGLEFDIVVLPQLHMSLGGNGKNDVAMPLRSESTTRVLKVYPSAKAAYRALFPELQAAYAQNRKVGLRDDLSVLYVAMTRARYALHMIVPADGEKGQGTSKSPARILRAALAPGAPAGVGDVLFEAGDAGWSGEGRGAPSAGDTIVSQVTPVRLRAPGGARARNLARRSPSSLEGGGTVDLAALLKADLRSEARLRGTVVHAWCEQIAWVEDGVPDDEVLRAVATREAPGVAGERLTTWIADFLAQLALPEVRQALSRGRYAPGTPPALTLERELRFLKRLPGGLMQGSVDRLVLVAEDSEGAATIAPAPAILRAEVIDFKTDLIDASDPAALDAKVDHYRPQIDAYREAVIDRYGLAPEQVTGTLVFLQAGVVRGVKP